MIIEINVPAHTLTDEEKKEIEALAVIICKSLEGKKALYALHALLISLRGLEHFVQESKPDIGDTNG